MSNESIYKVCKYFKVGDKINLIRTVLTQCKQVNVNSIPVTIISRHPYHLVVRHAKGYTESFTYVELLTGNSSRVRMEKVKR